MFHTLHTEFATASADRLLQTRAPRRSSGRVRAERPRRSARTRPATRIA